MAGFANDVVYANNGDFSIAGSNKGSIANGLLTNGQMWIGTTVLNAGGTHINVGTLTSPNGTVTIGYSSPNITLDVEDQGFVWIDQSGAFGASKNRGYFITGTATATLPAGAAQGDTIKFFLDTTQILTIQAATAQIIRLGSLVSSATGTATSTLRGDSVELTFRASDACWCAIGGFGGTWTMA